MSDFWASLAGLLLIVLIASMWGVVWFRTGRSKALSALFGILMVVPVANLVLFIILITKEWPIHRQIRELRIRYGVGTEEDAYCVLFEGIRLEAKGKTEDALCKYHEVVTRFPNTTSAKDAGIKIESLR